MADKAIRCIARANGVYGGPNLDATVIATSHDRNASYDHEKRLLPPAILVRATARPKGAYGLPPALSRAVK